ncbi:MAG: MFS transporter [Alphaproteobacteria bacterium]
MAGSAVTSSATRRETRAIWLIGAGHFMSHFYQLVLPPLFYFMKPDLDVTYAALGAVMTAFFVATAMVQVPVGLLIDRIGARKMLVGGLLLMSAGVTMAGFTESYVALVALFLLAGLGNSVFHPADFTILSATVGEERLGRAFGVHTFGGSVGFVAAPLMMVALAGLWNWRAALIAAGLIGIAIAVTIALSGNVLHDHVTGGGAAQKPHKKKDPASWRFMLSRPMVLFFCFYAFTSATGTGITNFCVVALIEVYGAPLTFANSALTVFLVAAMVGTLPGGHLADWTDRHDLVIVICFLVLAASVAMVGTASLPLWLILGALALAGFMRGIYNASRDILVKQAAPEGRIGSAFGFVTLGYALGHAGDLWLAVGYRIGAHGVLPLRRLCAGGHRHRADTEGARFVKAEPDPHATDCRESVPAILFRPVFCFTLTGA